MWSGNKPSSCQSSTCTRLALGCPDLISSPLAVGKESDLVLRWPIAHPAPSLGTECGCPLPCASHPLPTSQTPDTRCLPPPDTRWLPLFAFPLQTIGVPPCACKRFQSPATAWRGQPSLYLSGLLLIHPGSAILPAGHWHPSHTSSSFLPTFLFFTLRRTGQPVCLPHPPRRRSSGHGPFPLPAPATRWRPHSAFSFGLPGLGNSAVSSWKDLDAGHGSLVHPRLDSATCLSFQTLTPLSPSLRQGSQCCLSMHFQSLAGLASFFPSWFPSQLVSLPSGSSAPSRSIQSPSQFQFSS